MARWLRGRAGDPWAVQAADCLVRLETGIAELDALEPVHVEERGDDAAVVTFAAPGGRLLRAHVREVPTGRPRLTSCDADEPSDPGRPELVELTDLSRTRARVA